MTWWRFQVRLTLTTDPDTGKKWQDVLAFGLEEMINSGKAEKIKLTTVPSVFRVKAHGYVADTHRQSKVLKVLEQTVLLGS